MVLVALGACLVVGGEVPLVAALEAYPAVGHGVPQKHSCLHLARNSKRPGLPPGRAPLRTVF